VSTNVVATDSVLDCSKIHVIVEQHSCSKLNSVIIDVLLGLPVSVGLAQGGPIQIFYSLVFLPEFLDQSAGCEKNIHVHHGQEPALQNR
jgi:hypothetical protein